MSLIQFPAGFISSQDLAAALTAGQNPTNIDPLARKILWLSGAAGSGKSTLAQKYFANRAQLSCDQLWYGYRKKFAKGSALHLATPWRQVDHALTLDSSIIEEIADFLLVWVEKQPNRLEFGPISKTAIIELANRWPLMLKQARHGWDEYAWPLPVINYYSLSLIWLTLLFKKDQFWLIEGAFGTNLLYLWTILQQNANQLAGFLVLWPDPAIVLDNLKKRGSTELEARSMIWFEENRPWLTQIASECDSLELPVQ